MSKKLTKSVLRKMIKEELLKNYLDVCENTDHRDLIELDKQILQEKITTNEKHMIDLITKIEDVVSKIEGEE